MKFLWYLYVAIMFASVEVMAALFWYLHITQDRSVIIAEPNDGIFLAELILLSLAAAGTIVISLLWSFGKLKIELVGSSEKLNDAQKQLIAETNAQLQQMKGEMKK